jgi:hypothetical protein
MELLDNLRKIVDKKISLCSTDDLEKYKSIKALLKDDDCFFHIKRNTAYAILEDLDFLKKEIPIVYEQLIDPKIYLQMKNEFEIEG